MELGKFRSAILAAVVGMCLVVLGGLSSVTVLAQPAASEAVAFKNVTLWVYPEYDDPRLLVMLEGKLASGTAPVEVKFLVPAAAEMYSAGSKDASGKYTGGPPARVASQIPGWDEISYRLTTDTFRVEYYDPAISGESDKQISYDFRFLSPISDLRAIVQQPLKASNFRVTPDGTSSFEGQFAVKTYNFTDPEPAKPIHFDIAYTKTDSSTSVQPTATTSNTSSNPLGDLISSGPGGSSSSGPSSGAAPIAVLGVSVAAFAAFAGVVVIGRQRLHRPAPRRVEISTRGKQSGKKKFCHECGKPIGPDSKFCPNCGRRIFRTSRD